MIALFDEFPAGAHPTKDQYEHFSIGRADERTARRAQAARASTNDDGQTVADTADMDEEEYNDADVELPHQERIGHDVATVHISTVAFHQKILQELDDGQDEPGGRPPYHEWQSMWVEPPDPMVVVPFSEAAWHVQPICFFDPTVYFGRIGMESARGGWRHARFVRVQNDGKFRRPRLLKGRGADYGLSTVDMQCSECRVSSRAMCSSETTQSRQVPTGRAVKRRGGPRGRITKMLVWLFCAGSGVHILFGSALSFHAHSSPVLDVAQGRGDA